MRPKSGRFSNTLAFYVKLLESLQHVSRADICQKAGLSRNVITNIVNNPQHQPAYDTVTKLVNAINDYGVKPQWDLNDALVQAGWREPATSTAPREITDMAYYPMAKINIPIYDGPQSAVHGTSYDTFVGTMDIDTSYSVYTGLIAAHPKILTFIQTMGDYQDDDILLVRRTDVAELALMTTQEALAQGFILVGRVAGFLFPPTPGDTTFDFPSVDELRSAPALQDTAKILGIVGA